MELNLANAEDGNADQGPPVSLALLALINQARNEHGMRQQDFQRYRHFCSTKVHRLRETMNKTHSANVRRDGGGSGGGGGGKKSSKKEGRKGMSKKAKRKAQSASVQSEQAKGKGNVFERKQITLSEVQNDRPAQLLLFEAERAWAYGQDLRQQAFEKEQDGKLRRHGLSRARRAVQWSQQLLDLLHALGKGRVDTLTRAEAEAYHVLLRAYEAFDKEKHQESLELLSVARKVFYLVAEASNDSRKEALANSFVDGTEAMLRFCAYNLELSEQDMDSLSTAVATPQKCQETIKGYAELESELKKKAQEVTGHSERGLDEVEWRGKRIPVRNPDLVEVMTKVRSAEQGLRSSLEAKKGLGSKTKTSREHKRQRLTSAQRHAKRRGQTSMAASAAQGGASAVASASKTSTGSKTELDGYDSLLAALTEAEDVARRLVQDNAEALSKSHSGRYEAASTSLVNAHEYVQYKLLATRIERNLALMEEVQEKSEKRRVRAKEHVDERIKALTASGKVRTDASDKEPVRRRTKPSTRKVRPANVARSVKKKPMRSPRSAPSNTARTSKKKASPRTRAEQERLLQRGELKTRRIAARIIPGLARLLDANEMSCAGMSGLALIEADSNLSTLIEAKSAWYKAELLRLLARSFAWSDEVDKALLLLNRSELFVREARSAMELVEADEVEEEDATLLPPRMDEKTFTQTTEQITAFRTHVQRELYAKQMGITSSTSTTLKRISGAQSKAAQAVHDLASKYIDFDPIDLQQVATLSADLEDRFEREFSAGGQSSAPASRRPSAVPVKAAAAAKVETRSETQTMHAADAVASPEEEEEEEQEEQDFDDAVLATEEGAPYDPGNAFDDEEEEQQARSGQRTWLGGWFGRK